MVYCRCEFDAKVWTTIRLSVCDYIDADPVATSVASWLERAIIHDMSRRARQQLITSFLLIASLLFQQVAMAAYVCTMPQMQAGAAAMAKHCAGMKSAPAQLPDTVCQQHCAPDPTSASNPIIPQVPLLALPPLLYVLVLTPVTRSCDYGSDDLFARSDPPTRLRYCRLLI